MMPLSESLTNQYLAGLEAIQFDIKKKLQMNTYSGVRKSTAKGSSLEFSDFREYIAGDDLRRVDWNSFARFDKLFMKLFMEEKQASVNVFLDISKSMAMDEKKGYYSKIMAASIAYITLKNTDKFRLFACGEGIQESKLNVQSKNRFIEIVRFLDQLEYKNKTQLVESIKEAGKSPLGNGIAIIISDFFSQDGYKEAVKLLQYKKQDVILVQVLSEEEINPSSFGSVRLLDTETGEKIDVEMTETIIAGYRASLKSFQSEMKEFCYQRGARFVGLQANMPYLEGIYEIV